MATLSMAWELPLSDAGRGPGKFGVYDGYVKLKSYLNWVDYEQANHGKAVFKQILTCFASCFQVFLHLQRAFPSDPSAEDETSYKLIEADGTGLGLAASGLDGSGGARWAHKSGI